MINNIHKQISAERLQTANTRLKAIEEVEKHLDGRTLVTFFTSFDHPVAIDNGDCDMLQSVLQHIDLSKGLALMINSPGGDGLAAERIVATCRAYSGTKDYWAIVPGRAKSAATMVCMGASRILMAAPSELGPVDPQIIRRESGVLRQFSAYGLVSSYDTLFQRAVSAKGNLEPFLQQLSKFDVRDIDHFRDVIKLSEDIAIKILRSGMMNRISKTAIKKKIGVFLDPGQGTISHGRSINREEASDAGLEIHNLDVQSDEWKAIYELYSRADAYVSSPASCKCAESREEAFSVQVGYGD